MPMPFHPSWPGLTRRGRPGHPRLNTAHKMTDKGGWIYIMTNRPNGVLYVGVTSDLIKRISQHIAGETPGFTQKYGLKRLVYFERHEDIRSAITRETAIKKWPRRWKVQLITKDNFDWNDLSETIL
jgi:putative endonuclease